ncbi:leucyl/phenylalanyl-tRNA--protein transferase [Paracoccus tegillarcae]|uniref:Leucyl/phenylalanyl-tRNA--protein transferase n=1 Tax=Paracoccus tegillarcae TaxID=1529068 RepID=A0A2K9EI31_9RHOB|nr:leucyl/phenylalanyl-tRNA--protein transferase [Paracoccus tegillarcae]AUH34620.1 leucyl/phenylalanyl-tRNA--protein transferase [Paracoccus tegillarcae]
MLSTRQLLAGYAQGIFPMAESAENPELHWFSPNFRGVLPVGGIHASRSLRRALRQGGWSARLDYDFDTVVAACADRETTWINEPLADLYRQLHQQGHAHALVTLYQGEFAGGIFGVTLGGAFFGESMVSARPDGSKMALIWLSSHLARCGFVLFDTQMTTPHLTTMGAVEISRRTYLKRLENALKRDADFQGSALPDDRQLWQEITQTS